VGGRRDGGRVAPRRGDSRSAPGWPYALAALAGSAVVLLTLFVGSQSFYRVRSFSGGATLARQLAQSGTANDIYLFGTVLDGTFAGRMAAPLWTLEGRNSAVIASPNIDLTPLAAALDGWRDDGRSVWLLTDRDAELPDIPGYVPAYVDEASIVTRALAPRPSLPASWSPVSLAIAVYELLPDE
jgi:hypothetical protein